MRIANLFDNVEMNALYQALMDCSEDYSDANNKTIDSDRYDVYAYLDETPRASLIAEMVNKLNENGFIIVPKGEIK